MPIIEFDTKMRGYDPQQVNDAVTNFQDTINKYAQANTDLKRTLDTVNNQFTQANQDIDQLQAENKKLSERIEELEKQNDDLEAKIKNKYTSVGDDVRKLLEDTQTVYHAAEKNAADIKNKALQEADSIRKQSQSAAEKTMVDARQVAEKNVKESQAKSKQIIESAQQSAAQLRKEADSYATGRQNIAEQADARFVRFSAVSRKQAKCLTTPTSPDASLTPLQSSQLRRMRQHRSSPARPLIRTRRILKTIGPSPSLKSMRRTPHPHPRPLLTPNKTIPGT